MMLTGSLCILTALLVYVAMRRREEKRIEALIRYLEQADQGKAAILSATGEDAFSKLEDAIYKTVTALYHTRETAVQAKTHCAENLANIAHQLKTPLAAISLSLQAHKPEQIPRQLLRLTRLEEALLVLARLDAGVLSLEKAEIDVLTVLALAADNLQELFEATGTALDLPEMGEMAVTADLDWTMEALLNIMKNCIEHDPGGAVHCRCAQNPLYTEIVLRDEGPGFCKEDLPHLFDRFYRGKNAGEGGIGIGLALAKEIIERQNGTIRAENDPTGGACFTIRFYRHRAVTLLWYNDCVQTKRRRQPNDNFTM